MANHLQFSTGFDGTGFSNGVRKMGRDLERFKSQVMVAFGSIGISSLVRSTLQWASTLRDTADAAGVNVEWLQKMQNGAKLTGASIEDLSKFINEMNKSRAEAAVKPEGKAGKAFGRMGISQADITGLSTQDFFQKIIDAFKDGASVQLANDVQEVGGRAARNLISGFATQFVNDAPVLSEAILDQLDDIGDQFEIFKTQLLVGLAPAIAETSSALERFIDWIKKVATAIGTATGTPSNEPPKEKTGLARYGVSLPKSGWIGGFGGMAMEYLAKLLGGDEVGQAILDEEERQKKERSAISQGRTATKDARKRREQTPPDFGALITDNLKTPKSPKAKAERDKLYTDSLLSIGNFLGGGGRERVNNTQEQHLQVARMQLQEQKAITQAVKDLTAEIKSGTTEVPEW